MNLYIGTYGTYVHVKDNMFEIKVKPKNAEEQKHLFSAKKIKSIIFTTHAALSTDAVKLALKFNIDIIFLEYTGKPIGRFWHSKLGSTASIRKKQLIASQNHTGLKYTKEWVSHKIENQLEFIQSLKKHRTKHKDYLNDKVEKIKALQISVLQLEGEKTADIAETVRGLEGAAGRIYFGVLSYVLPEIYQFKGRSSRPAQDAFNAYLNYAYGILYSYVERALMIAGLDPYIGFLHRDDYNMLSFVFDFIENFRIYADTTVFRLFAAKKINKLQIREIKNGVSLNDEGKKLIIKKFNDYMESDSIRYKGRNQTRNNIILSEARTFANKLINKNTEYKPEKNIEL